MDRSQGPVIEPLVPERGPGYPGKTSLSRTFETYQPSLEALFDRIVSTFDVQGQHKNERSEPFTVIVTLTPDQALRGGHARIMVPVRVRCPNCSGYGDVGYYECWRCSGDGLIYGEYPVMICYPPGIEDGHTVKLSPARHKIPDLFLSVMFRIGELL